MIGHTLPPLATLAEFRVARAAQRLRPFLWFRRDATGQWLAVRLTAEQASKVSGTVLRLSRHELACRALLDVWDADVSTPPRGLVIGASHRSAKLFATITRAESLA